MRKYFIVLFLIFYQFTFAQKTRVNVKDSVVRGALIFASYSLQFPSVDLAKRFGFNSSIGGGVNYKYKNWLIGGEGNFIFGNNIRENNILDNLKNSEGNIIAQDGFPGVVKLFERGFYFSGKLGYVIRVLNPNPNSGILVQGGLGFLQHKIRIEVKDNNVTQLWGEYKKGYDRLTNGLMYTGFLGYHYLDNNRLINIFAGIELIHAFTQNRRDFNFDTMMKDESKRNDLLLGFRVGWIIPIYKQTGDLIYYY